MVPVAMLLGPKGARVVCGRPMCERVKDAFVASGYPVATVAGACEVSSDRGSVPLSDNPGISEKLCKILELHRDEPRVVITTCDIPCVTPGEISTFLEEAKRIDADAIMSVVDTRLYQEFENFPGTRVWVNGMHLTMGNIFTINPRAVLPNMAVVADLIEHRKGTVQLAWMAGPRVVSRLLVSQSIRGRGLSLPTLENAFSRLVGGISVRAVLAGPGIGFDADDDERRELLARVLEERAKVSMA